jgi:hypothetical protein
MVRALGKGRQKNNIKRDLGETSCDDRKVNRTWLNEVTSSELLY